MLSFSEFITEAILKDKSGKPIRFLHGTTKDFHTFNPGKHKRNMQLGFGIHFTRSPELANHYTGYQDTSKQGTKPGGHIKMVTFDVTKALDVAKIYSVSDPEYQFALALHKGLNRKLYISNGQFMINLDITTQQRAEKLLRQFGYDAVIYTAEVGRHYITGSGQRGFIRDIQAESILVLDPEQIKPAFN